jgi:prolipoprotein diacylglyceryltransferase
MRSFPAGTIFGMCLIASGIERFITEFWRNTPKIAFGWMSLAQFISIAIILAGSFIIIEGRKRHQNRLQAQS